MIELEVSGRLCLFGEHSDWAADYRRTHPQMSPGFCLTAGTDQSIRAEAEPRIHEVSISRWISGEKRWHEETLEDQAAALAAAAEGGGFFAYAFGTAAQLVARYRVGGISLRFRDSTLPVGKGLSSSAAACVLVARAFDRVHQIGLSLRDEMELAYQGERMTGSACGRMDQICAYGRRAMFMTFAAGRVELAPIEIARPLHILLVDLGRAKDTKRILADLNACFPDAPGAVPAAVREGLGPANAELLARAKEVVAAGDASGLGALMTEAQQRFDRCVAPACPELQAPRLHEVLAHPAARELSWGGKGVGSQGDGFAQFVARGAAEREALAARLSTDLGVETLPLTLEPTPPRRA